MRYVGREFYRAEHNTSSSFAFVERFLLALEDLLENIQLAVSLQHLPLNVFIVNLQLRASGCFLSLL